MRRLQTFFENFLLEDRKWSLIRLIFTLLVLLLFMYLGHYAFRTITLGEIVQNWTDRQNVLKLVPRIILKFVALFITDFRFLWISIGALLAAFFIGAGFMTNLHSSLNFEQSLGYLVRSIYGLGYPKLIIDDGNLELVEGETNLIRDVGGPGRLVVQQGNIVLLEHLDSPSRVLAEGAHFISRFETVHQFKSDFEFDGREIPTLDERHGYLEEISATTKDGIKVLVQDVHYRYRLRLDKGIGDYAYRSPDNPNPVSVQAVKDMAYNRSVRLSRKDGKPGPPEVTPWHFMVNVAFDGAIMDFIRENQLDDLVDPTIIKTEDDKPSSPEPIVDGKDFSRRRIPSTSFSFIFPRDEINQKILSKEIQGRFRNVGADLLWWDIGHFTVADPKIIQQFIDKWGSKWEGEALVKRARGEAETIRLLELAQAETQAEMLISVIDSIEKVVSTIDESGKSPEEIQTLQREKIRNIILAKTSQLLEVMASRNES